MGYNKNIRNRKYWDGLHAFSEKCYACEWLESDMCLGCTGNGSGEEDKFFPANCLNCANQNTNLCEDCDDFSNHSFLRLKNYGRKYSG
jgi:hypothetical protein